MVNQAGRGGYGHTKLYDLKSHSYVFCFCILIERLFQKKKKCLFILITQRDLKKHYFVTIIDITSTSRWVTLLRLALDSISHACLSFVFVKQNESKDTQNCLPCVHHRQSLKSSNLSFLVYNNGALSPSLSLSHLLHATYKRGRD